MQIIGYCDPLTVRPGETIRFKVSCRSASYRADIVRLVHGDENPAGPGFKEEPLETSVSGTYCGRVQELHHGSFVVVPSTSALNPDASFSVSAWVQATRLEAGLQGILCKVSDRGKGLGFMLVIDEGGHALLQLNDIDGNVHQLSGPAKLRSGEWIFICAGYDALTGRAFVNQLPLRSWPNDPTRGNSAATLKPGIIVSNDADLLMAAMPDDEVRNGRRTRNHFNGKLEAPSIYHHALGADEWNRLHQDLEADVAPAASWDFGQEIQGDRVVAVHGTDCHGITRQMPVRAMTGHRWTGEVHQYHLAPEQYGAIHFHDDDLVDADWGTDFRWQVPESLPSGIYAARLRPCNGTAECEDHVPFFVLPRSGAECTSDVAFLAPTCSYLAYANEQLLQVPIELCPNQNPDASREAYAYASRNRLLSLYDLHSDGSGVCYSSRLRPIVNLKPRFVMYATDCPHQFSADLHLVDWLHSHGFDHDVLTDEALHAEGAELLQNYRVIITGTHPEYWSGRMLDSLHTFLESGGRLMYLGGNGFYWVTSFDPNNPHVIEVRRSDGIRTWEAGPGERYHSTSGERGGLWRWRGKAPQSVVGVGFTAQGFDSSAPYRRMPDSYDPRAAFIFEGLQHDEVIGDCDSLVLHHGAAGFELDRMDYSLGTPAHALHLASSFGHSDAYQHSVEEVLMSDSRQGGTVNELVRADMLYFNYPNGGGVFSVGSISWCGALSTDGYNNSVSQITANVLRRFMDPDSLP